MHGCGTHSLAVGMAGRHPLLFPPSGWWQTHYRPSSASVWVPRGSGSAATCLLPAVLGEGARQLFRLIWEGWLSSARDAALHGTLGRGLGHPGPHKDACPQQRPVGEADHSQGHQEGRRWLPGGTCVRPVLPCRPSQRARLTHRPGGGTSLTWQKGCSAYSHAQSRASASP